MFSPLTHLVCSSKNMQISPTSTHTHNPLIDLKLKDCLWTIFDCYSVTRKYSMVLTYEFELVIQYTKDTP